MTHDLRTWKPYFQEVWDGKKKFEVRKNDRDFKVGDILTLMEYDHKQDQFTDRWLQANVDYILFGGTFGVESGYVVMSLTIYRLHTNGKGTIELIDKKETA